MCHRKYPSESWFPKAKQQVNIYLPSDESKWKYLHHCHPATAHNKQIEYIYAPKDLLLLKIIPGKVGILQYCRWQAFPFSTTAYQERKEAAKSPLKGQPLQEYGQSMELSQILFSEFMVLLRQEQDRCHAIEVDGFQHQALISQQTGNHEVTMPGYVFLC